MRVPPSLLWSPNSHVWVPEKMNLILLSLPYSGFYQCLCSHSTNHMPLWTHVNCGWAHPSCGSHLKHAHSKVIYEVHVCWAWTAIDHVGRSLFLTRIWCGPLEVRSVHGIFIVVINGQHLFHMLHGIKPDLFAWFLRIPGEKFLICSKFCLPTKFTNCPKPPPPSRADISGSWDLKTFVSREWEIEDINIWQYCCEKLPIDWISFINCPR